jgi:hypothetical protein
MAAAFQTRVWLLITLGPQLSHRESKLIEFKFQSVCVLATFMILVCRGVIRQNGLEDAPLQMMSFVSSNQYATATCERIYHILKFHAFENRFFLKFMLDAKVLYQWMHLPAAIVDYCLSHYRFKALLLRGTTLGVGKAGLNAGRSNCCSFVPIYFTCTDCQCQGPIICAARNPKLWLTNGSISNLTFLYEPDFWNIGTGKGDYRMRFLGTVGAVSRKRPRHDRSLLACKIFPAIQPFSNLNYLTPKFS